MSEALRVIRGGKWPVDLESQLGSRRFERARHGRAPSFRVRSLRFRCCRSQMDAARRIRGDETARALWGRDWSSEFEADWEEHDYVLNRGRMDAQCGDDCQIRCIRRM